MPTPVLRARVAPALLGLAVLALTFAQVAEAGAKSKTVPADLRVVSPGGTSLAEGTQYSGPVSLRTVEGADCFGPGTGGSGDRVRVDGSTALGQLAEAPGAFPRTNPLAVTDFFDFGLGLCGIGNSVAPSTGYWYLKVDHAASTTGGDQTVVSKRDEILWFLIEDFNDPVPDELELRAPASAEPGEEVTVKVVSYADNGTRSPAAGVEVTGAEDPTDAEGRTTVVADEGVTALRGSRPGSIASNSVALCGEEPSECPAGYATTIGGTSRGDEIDATGAAEEIVAGAGKDTIDARGGAFRDKIVCGPGDDVVIVDRGSEPKLRSCEKVKRR